MFIIYWPKTHRLWISDECEPYYPTAFPSECVWLVPGTDAEPQIYTEINIDRTTPYKPKPGSI